MLSIIGFVYGCNSNIFYCISIDVGDVLVDYVSDQVVYFFCSYGIFVYCQFYIVFNICSIFFVI